MFALSFSSSHINYIIYLFTNIITVFFESEMKAAVMKLIYH